MLRAIGGKATTARLQLGQIGIYIYSSPKSNKCSHSSVGIYSVLLALTCPI